MRGLVAADGGFTSGMVTYSTSWRPDNLGEGYATPMDRQWLAGLTPLTSAVACATWRGRWQPDGSDPLDARVPGYHR